MHVDIEHDGKRHCHGIGRGRGCHGRRGWGGRGRGARWCPCRQGEQKAEEKMEEAKNGKFFNYKISSEYIIFESPLYTNFQYKDKAHCNKNFIGMNSLSQD